MSEENKDIDNIFQSAIEPYTMEPSDKVWSSLEADLAKKKRSGGGYWNNGLLYSLLVVAVLMASLAAYEFVTPFSYINKTNANPLHATNKVTVATSAANADNKGKSSSVRSSDGDIRQMTDLSSSDRNVHDASNKNNEAGVHQNSSFVANTPATPSYKNTVAPSGGLTASTGKANASSRPSNNPVYAASSQNASPSSNNKVTASSQQDEDAAGEAKDVDDNAGDANSSNNSPGLTQQPSQTGNENTSTAQSPNEDASKVDDKENIVAANASEMHPDASDLASQEASVNADAAAAIIPLKEVKRRFSLDAFYAPEMAKGMINSNTGSTKGVVITSSEKINFSYNTGVRFRFDINDNWSASLGCTYSILDYSTTATSQYDSITIKGHGWMFPPKTDLIYVNSATRIQLQYVNIPVTVSYKLSHKRFDYYTSAGVSMNILANEQSTSSVTIGDSFSQTTNDMNGLRKTSYGYLFNIGARYNFYKGYSFFFEPSLRGSITSITQDSSTGFYPYYLGLNAGFSIRF